MYCTWCVNGFLLMVNFTFWVSGVACVEFIGLFSCVFSICFYKFVLGDEVLALELTIV